MGTQQQLNSEMKYLLLLTLVAVAAARGRPDRGDRPRPKPHPLPPHRGPHIFVRPVQRTAQNETLEFKFGVAGMKPLNESEVHLFKVKKGEKGPEFEDADFDISLKTLSEEEIKEWMDDHKDRKDDESDEEKDDRRRPHPKPHPRPHFKHAIVGEVSVADVTCDDQGPYLVRYGTPKDRDDKEEKDDDEEKGDLDLEKRHRHPRPHPRPPPGAFFLAVKDCKRPEPRDF